MRSLDSVFAAYIIGWAVFFVFYLTIAKRTSSLREELERLKNSLHRGKELAQKKKVGILMFQRGGPDSLEAVEPFLLNLFLDPDIIPMGPLGFLRRPLAKLISSRRSVPVRGKYAEIGGRSPIGTLTERQRGALVDALSDDIDPVAVVAMRYWNPLTAEAVEALRQAGPLDEIVLLPLYPQF